MNNRLIVPIIVYGAGQRGTRICQIAQSLGVIFYRVIDQDEKKSRINLFGNEVCAIESLQDCKKNKFYIALKDDIAREQAREVFNTYGFDNSYELDLQEVLEILYEKYSSTIKKEKVYERQILWDCEYGLDLGGIEAWTISVVTRLKSNNWNNLRVLTDKETYEVDALIEDQIIRTKISKANYISAESFKYAIEEMKLYNNSIFISSQIDDLFMAAIALKKNGYNLTIISVIHNGTEETYERYYKYHEYVDVYLGVSKSICLGMKERGAKKTYEITCPFYCQEHINRNYSTEKDNVIRIGFAGRIDGFEKSQKRMDYLLKVIAILVSKGISFEFAFAGNGPVKGELEEIVNEKKWDRYVKFYGAIPRKDIPAFWEKCDIAVNLSDFEGHSISQMEAMASGCVPVITDTSGARDDVDDGINGYVVPIGGYKEAAERIEYLNKNRYILPIMGQRAHEAVMEKSKMNNHIEFWEGLFNEYGFSREGYSK